VIILIILKFNKLVVSIMGMNLPFAIGKKVLKNHLNYAYNYIHIPHKKKMHNTKRTKGVKVNQK
jgi:hypothetical protein